MKLSCKLYNLYDKIRRVYIKINFLLISNGEKKANWLRKRKIFYYIGENCSVKTTNLPAEPFLVCLHNNVRIAAGCKLLTHSLTCAVFNRVNKEESDRYLCQHGKIEILDNVFVGANSIIMYGVTIGPNCIVAAGSVVTKDVPPNSVVAGVPAKIIGSFDKSMSKAKQLSEKYYGLIEDETVASLLKVNRPTFEIDKHNRQIAK